MNVGIALGAAREDKAEAVLRLALNELRSGNKVELFLVLNGVGLYELAERDPRISKLFDEALSAGLDLTACRACTAVHGARRSVRCETTSIAYLFRLWRRSERFFFVHRFRSAAGLTAGPK